MPDFPAHALAERLKRDPLCRVDHVDLTAVVTELCNHVHRSDASDNSPVQFAIKKLVRDVVEVHRQLEIGETERSINYTKKSIRDSQATLKSHEKRLAELNTTDAGAGR